MKDHVTFFSVQNYRFQWVVTGAMALLFGISCILPNLWQRVDPQYPFQGIEALGADQEYYYAVRIREVLDGHWLLGDVYHADKNLPYLQPPLPEWVEGGMGLLLGLKIGPTILLSKMLFGTLLFLCMTLMWTRLTARPWLSLLATSAVLFSWFLFASPASLIDALKGLPLGADFARFSRLTNPQFSVMLFFLSLSAAADWYVRHRRLSLLIAAVTTGVSFYAYPYTWSYLLVFFGLLFLWCCIQKEWKRVRHMVLFFCIVLIIALPSLLHLASASQHPAYPTLVQRFGLIHSRAPIGGYWMFIFLLLAVSAGKRISHESPLLIIIALSAIVVMNQQLVTGTVIVPHHYHWYFIHPLAVSMFMVTLGSLAAPYVCRIGQHATVFVFSFFLLSTVYWGIRYQRDAYHSQRQTWGQMQHAAGIYKFLDSLPRPIVYGKDLLGELVPVFTSADLSFAGSANIACLCPFDVIRDGYFWKLWLEGVTARYVEDTFLTTGRGDVSARLHGLYYREAEGAYERMPDDDIRRAIDAYRDYTASTFIEKLRRSPTDILILERAAPQNPHLHDVLMRSSLVYQDEWYEAWQINPIE